MSEQEYEISSPPPSLFFSDNEINFDKFEQGKVSLENYNEISFDEFEQGKVSLENYNEIFNDDNNDINLKDIVENEEEQDKIIDYVDDIENIEFTPCVVIDFVKVDREAIKEVDGVLSRLEVCDSHFQFDNRYLHKSQNKQVK
ncbi:hypothetical protein RclHR1_29410001, partial [Rhizophagus clarus]